MKIKAVVWQEDDVWCGSVPALPGCHTWADSYEQLLDMLEDAIRGCMEITDRSLNQFEVDDFLNIDEQT